MVYNPEKHNRKSTRLKGYDYSSAGGYFVTICVKDRQCLFGEIIAGEMNLSEIGQIAYNNWKNLPQHFFNVDIDEFVIMPNHLHGIIIINSENDNYHGQINAGAFHETPLPENNIQKINDKPLQNKIKNEFYANLSPKKNSLPVIIRLFKQSVTMACRKNKYDYFQWQRNYHEWIIRDAKHLEKFRNYIWQNPLKWEIQFQKIQIKKLILIIIPIKKLMLWRIEYAPNNKNTVK